MTPRLLVTLTLIVALAGLAPAQKYKTLALSAVAARGCLIYLTDGSAWEVRTEDRDKVTKWPLKTAVAVYYTNDSGWPYRLILKPGKADGDIVSAKRLVRQK